MIPVNPTTITERTATRIHGGDLKSGSLFWGYLFGHRSIPFLWIIQIGTIWSAIWQIANSLYRLPPDPTAKICKNHHIVPLKSEMWDQQHFNNPTGHLNQGLDAARHYYNVELMAQRWQEQQERHLTICHFVCPEIGPEISPKRWDFGVLKSKASLQAVETSSLLRRKAMRHRWKLGRVLNMSASYGLGWFGNGGFHYWLVVWNMFYFSIDWQ